MNPGNGPQLDLKLNLSPPRMTMSDHVAEPPSQSSSTSVSQTSPQSSCVSSEPNQHDYYSIRKPTNPEVPSMLLVGCPRCLMYVMLADDPRCPKCKSSVLLDVLHDDKYTRKSTKKS